MKFILAAASLVSLASAQQSSISSAVASSVGSVTSSAATSQTTLLVPAVGTTLTINPSSASDQATVSPTSTSSGSATVAAASTSVPSPTAALDSIVDLGVLPPTQALCNGGDNATYCPGELLQLVQLSRIFPDSKTFVDKPTKYSLNETYEAFSKLPRGNTTVGDVVTFVEDYFQGEGLELVSAQIENFTTTPQFLDNVDDVVYKGFSSIVHGYWTLLIRLVNGLKKEVPGLIFCLGRRTRLPCATALIVNRLSFR